MLGMSFLFSVGDSGSSGILVLPVEFNRLRSNLKLDSRTASPNAMTCHPIAQIAPGRNPISQENRPPFRRSLQNLLLKPPPLANCLNGLAILHGRYTGRADPRYQDPPARRGGARCRRTRQILSVGLSCAGIIVVPT